MKKPPPKPPTPPSSLAEYAQKRNFAVTREPAPEALPPADELGDAPPTFMVHKHDARRLHYDLRLEIEGALASWAVPNGPCYDPEEKRLAVQTEDHPLAYASFEGRIPDGEYGAGDALVWDRGLYETIPPGRASFMRQKGHLDLLFLGEKLQGRWHLVRTRGGQRPGGSGSGSGRPQWLLMKARDEYASADYDVVAERPESVVSGRSLTRGPTPAAKRKVSGDPLALLMRHCVWPPPPLLTAAKGAAPRATASLYVAQRGGERAWAAVAGGKVALQNAEGRDLAAAHPDVVTALRGLPVIEAVFEGELVSGAAARLYLGDLLFVDGRDLRSLPFSQRRELLGAVALPGEAVALAEGFSPPFAAALAAARNAGAAGLIERAAGEPYPPATPARLRPVPPA